MERLPSASLLKEILINYSNQISGISGVAISDRDGFIIASLSKQEDEEGSDAIIGALSAVLDQAFIGRIKREFGTSDSFFNITSTGDKKFVFSSMGPNSILTN